MLHKKRNAHETGLPYILFYKTKDLIERALADIQILFGKNDKCEDGNPGQGHKQIDNYAFHAKGENNAKGFVTYEESSGEPLQL